MKSYWMLGILMAAGLRAQPHDCNVDVYVITGFPMPGGMLLDARLKAEAMFKEIGVNLRIRRDLPAQNPSGTCGAPLVIQLEATTRYPVPPDALAYALPYQGSGTCIHVFVDRVTSNRTRSLADAVLAHVMVHEITHVLEQSTRHSDEGVMKAHWSHQDYFTMQYHTLLFASEDVDLVRTGLAVRLAASRRDKTSPPTLPSLAKSTPR